MSGEYQQTASDGGGGFRYEQKMTALIALRLLRKVDDFLMASNYKKAGKFDDIVFSYEDRGERYSWFIQIKHRNNPTLESKQVTLSDLESSTDFSIKKYFSSYKYIIFREKKADDMSEIFNTPIKHMKFFIYTNAILNDEVLEKKHHDVNLEILSTNPQDEKNIVLHVDKTLEFFEESQKNWRLNDFLRNKLVLCTHQACEWELDEVIQNEIALLINGLSASELKLVSFEWTQFIQQWCTDINNPRYLRKAEVQNTLDRLKKEAQIGKNTEFSVKFVESFLKTIVSQLQKSKVIHYIRKVESSILCTAALHQIGLNEYPNVWLPLQNIEKSNWSLNDGSTLVLDCEGDMLAVDTERVAKIITSLQKIDPMNRIILVSSEENEAAANISRKVNAEKTLFNCTLGNISGESRGRLLDREVSLQGFKVRLSSLLPSDTRVLDDIFDMTSMTQQLQGRLLNIGKKIAFKAHFYIPRCLGSKAVVGNDFFYSECVSGSFALSNITLKEAQDKFRGRAIYSSLFLQPQDTVLYGGIIVLEGDPAYEFQKLSAKLRTRIHWFDKVYRTENFWMWKNSTGNSKEVLNVLQEMQTVPPFENIEDINQRIAVISGDPGMGKSTLLEYLAEKTKQMHPSNWIVAVALNDYRDELSKDFLNNVEENTKNIIAHAAGVKHSSPRFVQRFFNYCYNVAGNIIVLLDGFDEVAPDFTKQGLALIKGLKNSAVAHVWVTSRPAPIPLLEEATDTISLTIMPLDCKDQKMYLKEYLKTKIGNEENKVNKLLNQILFQMKKLFGGKFESFLQVPLLSKHLVDVVVDWKKEQLKDNLNILHIVEELIRMKRDIRREKAKILSSMSFEQKRLENLWESDLMNLALLTLIPFSICSKLSPSISQKDVLQLKHQVSGGHEKSGFLLSFNENSPRFIDKLFAEYFVALFFTKNINENRKFLSSDYFFSAKFATVKYFYDRMLSFGKTLHEAVLNWKISQAKSLPLPCDVNAIDAGGRTALHLAVTVPDSGLIISLLLGAGARLDVVDTALKWTPLEYALKARAVENIAPLLEFSNHALDTKAVPITWKTLLTAVRGDYLKLFIHLLENGIYSVESLDDLSDKMWLENEVTAGLMILHLAAAYNSVKILKYLLRKDTRDSKARLIDSRDSLGRTPLLLAASRKCTEAAILLLDSGADPLVTFNDKNLFEFAAEAVNLELLCRLLYNEKVKGVDPLTLMNGALRVMTKKTSEWPLDVIFNFCKQFPGVINATAVDKILAKAAAKGNYEVVEYLCRCGAEVNQPTDAGYPLILAVTSGCVRVVRLILEVNDVKVNVVDSFGRTAVYVAAFNGFSKIFNMLVDAGADLNCCTSDGCDLSHAVASSCNSDIFFYLTENKLNFSKPNAKGETGLSLLRKAKAYDLLSKLEPSFETPLAAVKLKSSDQTPGFKKPAIATQQEVKVFQFNAPVVQTVPPPNRVRKAVSARNNNSSGSNTSVHQNIRVPPPNVVCHLSSTNDDPLQRPLFTPLKPPLPGARPGLNTNGVLRTREVEFFLEGCAGSISTSAGNPNSAQQTRPSNNRPLSGIHTEIRQSQNIEQGLSQTSLNRQGNDRQRKKGKLCRGFQKNCVIM